MRALVQRVTEARVRIDGEVVGAIGAGLCVFVGVTHDDDRAKAARLAAKVFHLRVLDGERSVAETGGGVLLISQFTLYADTSRGRRPSWLGAARPEHAEPLVEAVADELRTLGAPVASGRFRAHMVVELVNDGPVTLMLEV
jgi:D-aminoacyl-tRNA deacylase